MPPPGTQFMNLVSYTLPGGIAVSLTLLIIISLAMWINSILDATGFTYCQTRYFSTVANYAAYLDPGSQKSLRGKPVRRSRKLWFRRIDRKSKQNNTAYAFRRTCSTIEAIEHSTHFDMRQVLRKNVKRERHNRSLLVKRISAHPDISYDDFYILTKRNAPRRLHWLRYCAGPRPIRRGLSHLFDHAGRGTTLFLIIGFIWSLSVDRQFSEGPIMLPILGAFFGIFYAVFANLIVRNRIFSSADKWLLHILLPLILLAIAFLVSWAQLFTLYLKIL